jgi:general secretion pathway protein L
MAWRVPKDGLVALELAAERAAKELLGALPQRLRTVFGDLRWRVIDANALPAAMSVTDDRPVALGLPTHEFLLRRIELPLTARLQLADLMRFEAPRHVPLPPDQARLDFRIVSRDLAASRMVVEIAVIRAAVIEEAHRSTKALGLEPEAVAISTAQGVWFARRLLERSPREVWFNARLRRLGLRAVIPIALALAWVAAAQNWAGRLADERDREVVAARGEAEQVVPLRQELAALNDRIAFLAAARGQPSAAVITEEVARLLPDDAWLQELDIDGQAVHVRGTAHRATDLLGIFSASPLFTDVKFEAPLTQAYGAAGDQFDIAMTRN